MSSVPVGIKFFAGGPATCRAHGKCGGCLPDVAASAPSNAAAGYSACASGESRYPAASKGLMSMSALSKVILKLPFHIAGAHDVAPLRAIGAPDGRICCDWRFRKHKLWPGPRRGRSAIKPASARHLTSPRWLVPGCRTKGKAHWNVRDSDPSMRRCHVQVAAAFPGFGRQGTFDGLGFPRDGHRGQLHPPTWTGSCQRWTSLGLTEQFRSGPASFDFTSIRYA